jgi:hypothetical protein
MGALKFSFEKQDHWPKFTPKRKTTDEKNVRRADTQERLGRADLEEATAERVLGQRPEILTKIQIKAKHTISEALRPSRPEEQRRAQNVKKHC